MDCSTNQTNTPRYKTVEDRPPGAVPIRSSTTQHFTKTIKQINMGASASKQEEIVIAQAGNSGGQTSQPPAAQSSTAMLLDLLGVATALGVVGIGVYFIVQCCKRRMDKRIRKEVYKSRETLHV
ncbi:hypothetical protein ABEB36_012714 [Hypothenemus hampei]|uniref:Uncharacterized protein n=1 Tax=Hypothenemus hampei TaxID=57062 RepID=A0ABD1EC80_HYPHA